MKSKILLIPAILFAILMTNCSKTGGTGPSIKLDSDLLGNWILQTYTDDDGLQNYTGFLNIETNGNMNGEIVDIEENITAEFSGIATSENSILTTNITDSNSIWIETGIYEWDYQITGSALILEGNQDDEFLVLGFSQDGNSDEKGILSGVVSGNRTLLEDVSVQILGTTLSALTNIYGEYTIEEIPVGFYSVKFSKTGYDSYTENNVQILMNQTSNINASITEITDGFGEVSGFVADAVNQVPLNNAEVIIEGTSFTTITSADGLYSFADVPANNYTISCSKTDFEDYSQSIIIIANEEINADFLLLPEGSTTYGSINGIVTNTDGEPIPNVVCAVVGLYISALSDEDGSYEISLIPGGTYDISFTKPGYETVIIENIVIENGAATSLNTQIQQISGTGNLICYVENVQEFPINGALIEILDTTFSGSTGIVGMCSIQQIPTGIYTIRISKTGYQTQERENVEILAELPQTLYITLLN